MPLFIPQNYRPKLVPEIAERAIQLIKDEFQSRLSQSLHLRRVTAPLFVLTGTGINDDLNGIERAVSFPVKSLGDRRAEVVHSLAKWKRMKLGSYDIAPGFGLYTDMNAIRADEELDNIHSLYVDQWDWEKTIVEEQRNLTYLKQVVSQIYDCIREMEEVVYQMFPHITPTLPQTITFIHAQQLLDMYPDLSAKEREFAITKKHGAVFLIGIGGKLSDGEKHDGRAPDYDDWSSKNEDGFYGLNGDILVWNPILQNSFELSSMGIRVDKKALLQQLELCNAQDRQQLTYHQALLNDQIPLSIGGGIGQSRLCMLLIRSAHIGEVQASLWSEEMKRECKANNIYLM